MANTSYHHGNLKQALVAAAREQLAEHGVASLNLRALARGLGVTHPAVYRHFKDKDALLEAVAEEGFIELTERLQAASAVPSEDHADGLEHMASAYIEFALDHPELLQLMFALMPASERMQNQSLYAASKQAYTVLLSSVAHADTDPYISSAVVWALFHGLATLTIDKQLEVLGDPDKRKLVVKQAAQVLARGLS